MFFYALFEMIFFLLFSQIPGFTQFRAPEIDSITKHISLANEQKLVVEADISSFRLELKRYGTVREPPLLNAKIKYDSVSVMPVLKYQIKDRVGELSIQEEKKEGSGIFGFKNTCELTLTPKIPLCLELSSGASNIDLSGLKVAKLNLETSGKSTLCFNSPNPVKCEELYISTQIGNFRGEYLGNANFDVFHFQGGIGLYTLDFRGEFSGSRRVEIAMGGGSLKLILPKEVGIRLKPTGIGFVGAGSKLSLVEVEEGWYESQNWDTTGNKLIIHIDSSFGILRVKIL